MKRWYRRRKRSPSTSKFLRAKIMGLAFIVLAIFFIAILGYISSIIPETYIYTDNNGIKFSNTQPYKTLSTTTDTLSLTTGYIINFTTSTYTTPFTVVIKNSTVQCNITATYNATSSTYSYYVDGSLYTTSSSKLEIKYNNPNVYIGANVVKNIKNANYVDATEPLTMYYAEPISAVSNLLIVNIIIWGATILFIVAGITRLGIKI